MHVASRHAVAVLLAVSAFSAAHASAPPATRESYDNLQLERAALAAKRWLELVPASEVARRYLATSLLRLYEEDEAAVQFAELLKTSYADRARGYLVLLGILSAEDNETGAARPDDHRVRSTARLARRGVRAR